MAEVWWLRAGDVAALIGDEPLTFEWDDGHSWGFRFRGKPVEWDHSADSAIGGLESVFGDEAGAQLREAIRRVTGHGFEPSPLNAEDRAVLDLASRALRTAPRISGRKLRADLGNWDQTRFGRVRNRLRPRYLAETVGPNGELYNPLIAGLLASSEKDAAEAVIVAGLRLLGEKYAKNADVESYAPEEVLAAGGFAESDRQWVTSVLVISGLAPEPPFGTLPGALGVPRDVETLRSCTNLRDFIRATSKARDLVRVWPTAPLKLAPAHESESSRVAAARDGTTAAGRPPQPNVTQSVEILLRSLYKWERARDEAGKRGLFNSKSVADELGWTAPTLNRAVQVLEKRSLLEVDESSGSTPYVTHGFALNEEGFLECERLGLDGGVAKPSSSVDTSKTSTTTSLDEYIPPVLLPRFHVVQHLGDGSYAAVYQVMDRETLQRFALKVTVNTPEARERARRESDAAESLAHANILEVLEQGEDGRWFLLPLAEGTLGQLHSWGRTGPESAVEFVVAVGNALAHAHDAGFLHRDLHPDNVLRHDGRWKVADWGLTVARKHDRLTRTKSVGGSVTWTAPEQLKSLKDADERSDLFSLGRLAEWLVSGRVPDPTKSGDLRDHALAEFVRRATCLERSERPANVQDALALLPAATVLDSAADAAARTTTRASANTKAPPKTFAPEEFDEKLSAEDLAHVDELIEDLRKWFEAKHEAAQYNTVAPPSNRYPARVWDEFARRLREAGWNVDARGAMLIVERPSRR